MRNDEKIMRYMEMKEDSRQRFVRTDDKTHLKDMFTLDREIEKEMNKEVRILAWVLVAVIGVTIAAPWLTWWLGSR